MALNETRNLYDVLVSDGKLTADEATKLRQIQLQSGKTAEELLSDPANGVSESDLTKALASFHNIPFVDINETGSAPEALDLLDQPLATRYKMLPFSLDTANNRLLVAMANPLDLSAITFVEQKTGKRVVAHFATPSDLARHIEENYSSDITSDVTGAVEETETIVNSQAAVQDLASLNKSDVIKQAPIAKIVEQILGYAVGSNTSDVHIEPQANRVRVRFRIDGMLNEKLILPKSIQDSLISRVKILSNIKIDEKRIPQDGRFNFRSDKGEVDLRVSTLPTTNGEKIVMRLLRKMTNIPTLEMLGMSDWAYRHFNDAIHVPHGIILITGPTGSGKTTTLYSAMDIINDKETNIMTLEDPVEYEMTGINQVQVNVPAGLTFASGLRSFLRQDPDVIMVGEIRDSETAGLAVQASLTGHLVFSTLHTNSSAGAVPRLIDMGVEPFLLSSSLNLVMAQRVARRLNKDYVEAYKPDSAVLNDIYQTLGQHFIDWCQTNNKRPEDVELFRPAADKPSSEPDYKGRIAIYEALPISETVQGLVIKNRPAVEIEEAAMKEGMLLMKQDGYIKALNGVTTLEEVLRVAQV